MLNYEKERDNIIDFLVDKDKHLFHPIFSHDLYHFPKDKDTSGWKISIQGKVVDDAIDLLDMLAVFLADEDIHYKVATKTRFDMVNLEPNEKLSQKRIDEQSKKAMTIYCPSRLEIMELCEKIEEKLKDYSGYLDVPNPTDYMHYSGGIYYRNDTDEDGNYISPNN